MDLPPNLIGLAKAGRRGFLRWMALCVPDAGRNTRGESLRTWTGTESTWAMTALAGAAMACATRMAGWTESPSWKTGREPP